MIPFTVGNWNLINRVIAPLISAPGGIVAPPAIPEGVPGSRVFGLGDINYSLFLSPARPGKVIWGVGPSLTLPTATDDQLGSRKWSAGPAVVLLTQPPPWSLGVLIGNLWSCAGDADRRDVNQFILQPFVNYNLSWTARRRRWPIRTGWVCSPPSASKKGSCFRYELWSCRPS